MKKSNSGRKPLPEKQRKKPVTIYIPENKIASNGGIVEFRLKVIELINESL